jgi:hypothetical protein
MICRSTGFSTHCAAPAHTANLLEARLTPVLTSMIHCTIAASPHDARTASLGCTRRIHPCKARRGVTRTRKATRAALVGAVVSILLGLGAVCLGGVGACASSAPIPIDGGLFNDVAIIDSAQLIDR